ncbi:cytochrome b/b6 domain-containing protein [Sphingomonas sp. ID0503]|uniref:cytochrome b/b6 domain-containing protein n=1 Tax=Sphingomonas sp. ID0503 TaxID=3399691 RepID=UPI003AFA1266
MNRPGDPRGTLTFRHRLPVRIWHWVNAVTVLVMLMSGLSIFNAHPRLYWGEYGANQDRAWLEIGGIGDRGLMRVGPVVIPTTGVLGRWTDAEGRPARRAFPYWATLPAHYSLAEGRRWHLAFAWVLGIGTVLYAVWSLVARHLTRDLMPRRAELTPKAIWHDLRDHLRLRLPKGDAALRYNLLQKLAYLMVLLILLPLLIATGLTMSPALNAAWPWLLELFGGRQSARSIHFICAAGMTGFVVVHLVMVVLAGPVNELRSMITGWIRVRR